MNALPLISAFSDRGITATVTGADLNLNAPKGALTPKLVSCLREDKRDVILWLDRLRNELGADWQEVSQDPAQLRAAADSLMTQISRQQDVVPAHYTAVVYCQTCSKDVPHFPVGVEMVGACVWCMNGQPVPVSDVGCANDTDYSLVQDLPMPGANA